MTKPLPVKGGGVTPEQLLTGKGIEETEASMPEKRIMPLDMRIIEDYHGMKDAQKKRLLCVLRRCPNCKVTMLF